MTIFGDGIFYEAIKPKTQYDKKKSYFLSLLISERKGCKKTVATKFPKKSNQKEEYLS